MFPEWYWITTAQYQTAGDWVGILFAVQAIGSVIWATIIPMIQNRKFAYVLSLVLGGIGFISIFFIHNQYALFASFILIGCAWAAMLALPFTILTNALTGGHMGTYLGLFNGTICIPQIVAASLGGIVLKMFTSPGSVAPEMKRAGISWSVPDYRCRLCKYYQREVKRFPKVIYAHSITTVQCSVSRN